MAEKKKKKKRKLKKPDFSSIKMVFSYNLTKFIVPLAIVMILGILVIVFIEEFKVETVSVEGAGHYTTEEITDYVFESKLDRNTVFLYLKYKNKSIKDVPFVEQMDVSIVDKNTVKINVYEKYVAGCVSNLGNYLYFDNDGKVVEVSPEKTEGVPVVTGLDIEYFKLYEKLPVDDDGIFNSILTITKLLNKYDLQTDIIYFDEKKQVTLFFGNVRVNMADCEALDEKMMVLPGILSKLEGKSGVLHMEKYDKNDNNIVFNEDV